MRQVNTWLVIAFLALAGWAVDALRLFLEMHETLSAGLGAFARHFWYAIPMTVAVIVLTRLQPKARLLGMMVYDETGQPVQQLGDFSLDELTAKAMLGALRHKGNQGLHSLWLPSGANVYFVHQDGVTVVLGYSGPVSSRELASHVQLHTQAIPALDLLEGLKPPVSALAAGIIASPLKRKVLAYLYRNSHTSMQAVDLAYWVGGRESEVVQVLEELIELGLIEREQVCGLDFYRLGRNPAIRSHVNELFVWLADWQTALARLEGTVGRVSAAQGTLPRRPAATNAGGEVYGIP